MTDTQHDRGSADPSAGTRVQDEHGFDARRRVSATLVLAVFGVALLLPWVVGRGLKTGESDKPAEFPHLSVSSVVDDSAFRQVDAAIKDRLPFKAIAVRAVGVVGTRVLHRSMTPLVVMAPGQPPFLAEDFTSCTPFDAATVKKSLDAFASRVDAAGKSLAVFVAPDKSTVLRADLGSRADALLACADPIRQATQDTWPDATGVVVPLFSQMSAAERAHPGTTYQYGDSHWLPAGARIFSASVIQWLSAHGELPPGAWDPSAVVVGPATNKGGDLFRLMGAPRTDVVHDEKSVRPGVTTTMTTRHGIGAETYEFHSTSTGPALVPGSTIVVRDSFFSRAMPQLAPYFEHLTVMHWGEFMKEAPAGTLPPADHYVFETVQRGWSARASRVLGSPRYMNGVAKSLGIR
jgi:hypothetical protein